MKFYPFMQSDFDFQNTSYLRLPLEGLPVTYKVVCTSSSRNGVDYELYDEFGELVSERSFEYNKGLFNKLLTEDLNVLLEAYDTELNFTLMSEMTKKAYQKCEGRYGYSIEGGDCIITISGAPNDR